MLKIEKGDFSDPQVLLLLKTHFDKCHEVTPTCSAHAFNAAQLNRPEIDFWVARENGVLLGMGALYRLNGEHGEIKSMHTYEVARKKGVGRAMLRHIVATAKVQSLKRLSLETGSFAFFEPAVALYRSEGFVDCPPFEGYKADANSVFLTKLLQPLFASV